MATALEQEIDRKWPLPEVADPGPLTVGALRRSYEQERERHRELYPVRDGNDEATCPARHDPTVKEQLKHRWNASRTACVFCGIEHATLYPCPT